MYNSLKKLLGIGGVLFLLMGSVSFGQNWTEINLSNNSATNASLNRNNNTNTTNPGGNPIMMQDKSLETADKQPSNVTFFELPQCNEGDKYLDAQLIKICKCPETTKPIDWVCKPCTDEWVCCGIKLNTNVPFIGNCIELSKSKPTTETPGETTVTEETAFPILMGSLTKILVTIIILIGFIGILIGWVMITASWGSDSGASKGKELIWRVIIALALLGASWVILRLINPNFFW